MNELIDNGMAMLSHPIAIVLLSAVTGWVLKKLTVPKDIARSAQGWINRLPKGMSNVVGNWVDELAEEFDKIHKRPDEDGTKKKDLVKK